MRKYEACFLLNPALEQQKIDELIGWISQTIEKNGGKIFKAEPWGKRNLAYRIYKFKEAVYQLFYFEADPPVLARLEEEYKLREDVLRHLIILLKKFPEDGEPKPK